MTPPFPGSPFNPAFPQNNPLNQQNQNFPPIPNQQQLGPGNFRSSQFNVMPTVASAPAILPTPPVDQAATYEAAINLLNALSKLTPRSKSKSSDPDDDRQS